MKNTSERIVDAYAEFMAQFMAFGWKPYLLTFMFEPIPGRERSKLHQMERRLENAYRIFVPRACRKPRTAARRGELPIWICSPDLPIFKWDKRARTSVRDTLVNDGLHYHANLLMPPHSRMTDVAAHFENMRHTYLRQAGLQGIDVEPIVTRPSHVNGYGLKQVSKARFDAGDVMVLPRALGELHGKSKRGA